jgi:DNA topoisomerase I
MKNESELEGYCLKCKEKRLIMNPQPEWAANGTPATRGECPVCGTTIYRRGHTPRHDTLPKPEVVAPQKRKTAATAKGRKKSSTKTPAKKGPGSAAGNGRRGTTGARHGAGDGRASANDRRTGNGRRSGNLVIVESPAKARTINRYLGRGYTVKSSVGHVRDLLKSRLSVDVEHDFEPEYRVPNDKRTVVKELQAAAARAERIYLATDPDREGEAIAWHVLEAAEMEPQRTKRVVFQEITRPAVLAAFQQPREIDMDRVNAQQARRILDRLVGYKLSPLLWRKVRGRLSAGRVQSVAVRLVVEREREIDAFDVEEYWSLSAQLSRVPWRHNKPRPFFQAKLHQYQGQEPVLRTEAEVLPHLDRLEEAEWTVGEVRLGQRNRRPAAPFTTSTLQQEASRRLNFGASKTMSVAQQLYEGVDLAEGESVGLITYMRTDSVAVSKDAQEEARRYITTRFNDSYLPDSPPIYKTRSRTAQEAHEAIRPTSVERLPEQVKAHLTRDKFRLYQLIWERFVASQMTPAIYDTVSADVWAGEAGSAWQTRPYLFRATGSTLRFAGFLALYEETEPSDRPDGAENQVPSDLEEREQLDLLRLLPEQHFTQPPPRFSEATLVKALEEYGIGRPSTYATIISTVQQRGYVYMEEKRLRPTETGELVNDLLVEYFPDVMSVDFTARMEDELDEIAEGKPWVPVLAQFYDRFAEKLEIADQSIEKVDLKVETEPVGRACPECGSDLLYREGRFGRFIGCSNFPKCRYTEQVLMKIGVLCPNCGGDLVEKRTRKGNRLFFGCANYPECEWTSWKRPLPQPCPACAGLMVQIDQNTADCTLCGKRQPVALAPAASEVPGA